MLEILKYIFSRFWIFIGVCILLGIILEPIYIIINNHIKIRCAISLSKDGKTSEEIDNLLGTSNEDKDDKNK